MDVVRPRPPGTPRNEQKTKPYKLWLRHHLSPGDCLVMTAAIESLHLTYPGQFLTGTQTTCQEIWANNPRITPGLRAHECEIIHLGYPLINSSNQIPNHFMAAFCEDLGKHLGLPLPLKVNRPSLYLTDEEKKEPDLPKPYVILNAGVKSDFTCKGAGETIYQEIVDHFADKLNFIQVGERNPSHFHKPLKGVIDKIGQTTTRQLFSLAYHSVCGLGPVSFLHHINAAFGKPYVCYLGGREPLAWEQYSTATMLSTLGQLECCKGGGCWKSRVVKLNDRTKNDDSLCSLPMVQPNGETIPGCMSSLGSKSAIEAIERMLNNGIIK